MKLPSRMIAALEVALRQDGLRRVHDDKPGRPPWPAHPSTLRALERRGMLKRSRTRNRKCWPVDVWTITDAGRVALDPPPKPRKGAGSIRAGRGTTLLPIAGGEWEEVRIPEPEPVGASWSDDFAKKGRERHMALRGERVTKERLNRAGRAIRAEGIRAARLGVDVEASLERIERELDEMRRLREQQAREERKAA